MLKYLSCSCYPQLVQNVHSKIKMIVYTMSAFPSDKYIDIWCIFHLNLSTYLYFAVTRQQKIAKIVSQTPMPVDMEQSADDMKQPGCEQPVEYRMCEKQADDVEQPADEAKQPVCEQPADEVEQPVSEQPAWWSGTASAASRRSGTTSVRTASRWSGKASVWTDSRQGATGQLFGKGLENLLERALLRVLVVMFFPSPRQFVMETPCFNIGSVPPSLTWISKIMCMCEDVFSCQITNTYASS